jgi:hypothetical protein
MTPPLIEQRLHHRDGLRWRTAWIALRIFLLAFNSARKRGVSSYHVAAFFLFRSSMLFFGHRREKYLR